MQAAKTNTTVNLVSHMGSLGLWDPMVEVPATEGQATMELRLQGEPLHRCRRNRNRRSS